MDHIAAQKFQKLVDKLSQKFEGDGVMDLNSVLFIIGIQEHGKGHQKYSKDEKMNLMHIAICTVLEPYGFYKYSHTDPEGWPHFDRVKAIPALNLQEQEELLKQAVLNYFEENKIFEID